MMTLPAEKLMAAPHPNALRPIHNGSIVEAKLSPNDLVKLYTGVNRDKK